MISLTGYRDQIILDAAIEGNPEFGIIRLNRIINVARRYVQAQLNGLGFKKWETSLPVTLSSGTFSGQAIKKFGINALTGMLESPKSIPFIECNDGTSYGVAYPMDADKFKDKVVNTYAQATIKDPVFTRLANMVLLTPSTITSAISYYYRVVKDLTDTTISITEAIAGTGIVTVTAVNHGLSEGATISIAGVTGMTDLNSTFQISVVNSSTFTVPVTTIQSYITGGAITVYDEIPAEFEDFVLRKSVLDIGVDQGKITDKEIRSKGLENDITSIFQKFYGTLQAEDINQQSRKSQLQ